jgi:hypothetical protein
VEYIATATAGTRVIAVQLLDSGDDDVVRAFEFAVNPVAGETKIFEAAPFLAAAAGTVNHETIPAGFVVLPGQTLRIGAISGFDTGADDMQVHVTGRVHEV